MLTARLLLILLCLASVPALSMELFTSAHDPSSSGSGQFQQVIQATSATTGAMQLCFTETTAVSQSVTTHGKAVTLIGSVQHMIDGNAGQFRLSLWRDSTELQYTYLSSGNPSTLVLMYIETPAAGTYTYTLQVCTVNNATGSTYGPSQLQIAEHT